MIGGVKKRIFICSLFVLSMPLFAHATVERYSQTLFTSQLQHRTTVEWNQLTLRIPKNALHKRTTIKLQNRGVLTETTLPTPSEHVYTPRSSVYAYHIGGTPHKTIRARIDFDFTTVGNRRKVILFLPNGGTQWKKLPTTMHKQHGYLSARLPKRSGKLLITTNRHKREQPKKRSTFSPYAGTPYSDKAVVMDVESGKFLYKQKAYQPQHIASITKLATVYVFLQQQPDMTEIVEYHDAYDRIGATVDLEEGDMLSLSNVLYSTLLPSANNMAMLLSDHAGFSQEEFVEEMNHLTEEWNLDTIAFVEPTGLDARNVSSPANMARFALHVFQTYPEVFAHAADMHTYSFDLRNDDRTYTTVSTNLFDGRGQFRVKAFKTGYYPGTAERTLAIWIEPVRGKGEIMIVLFGNPVYGTINDEAYDLAEWAFSNWRFHNY